MMRIIDDNHLVSAVSSGWKAVPSKFPCLTATITFFSETSFPCIQNFICKCDIGMIKQIVHTYYKYIITYLCVSKQN